MELTCNQIFAIHIEIFFIEKITKRKKKKIRKNPIVMQVAQISVQRLWNKLFFAYLPTKRFQSICYKEEMEHFCFLFKLHKYGKQFV